MEEEFSVLGLLPPLPPLHHLLAVDKCPTSPPRKAPPSTGDLDLFPVKLEDLDQLGLTPGETEVDPLDKEDTLQRNPPHAEEKVGAKIHNASMRTTLV